VTSLQFQPYQVCLDHLPWQKLLLQRYSLCQRNTKNGVTTYPFYSIEQSTDFIALDPITRRNLEIIEPLFEHGTSLFQLINDCQTAMGGRLLSVH
jgi:DNA mismatch repair protein MutS